MKKGLKGYFITGLLVVVPLYITAYVLALIVGFMDGVFNILPVWLQPDTYLPFHIPGLGLMFTLIGILLVGVLTQNFLGQKLLVVAEAIMARVPVVRVVYNSTKQFMETFFSSSHEGFSRVVLVEFPRKGAHSIGFLTGKVRGEMREKTGGDRLNVFVPTTPNPTTGFYIAVPEAEVIKLNMKVEDAFKIIMSGGMIMPDVNNAAQVPGNKPDVS